MALEQVILNDDVTNWIIKYCNSVPVKQPSWLTSHLIDYPRYRSEIPKIEVSYRGNDRGWYSDDCPLQIMFVVDNLIGKWSLLIDKTGMEYFMFELEQDAVAFKLWGD